MSVFTKGICTIIRVWMNLNMIQPKNQTEDLLLSIIKNYETLIEQTHRKTRRNIGIQND